MPKNEKKSTIESYAFIRWWEARRRRQPIPKNPYHAFMTDKALKATIPESQAEWRKQPNRRDLATIDFPPHVRRKMERAERKRKPLPKKERKERRSMLKQFIKKMSFEEKIEPPKLVAMHTKGYLKSRARIKTRIGLSGPTGLKETYSLELGMKGSAPLVKAMTAHELGHIKSAKMTKRKREEIIWEMSGEPQLKGYSAERLKEEKLAWKIGEKYFSKVPTERSRQSWLKRFALETYYQSPRYGIPRKQKMKWTVT